MFLPYFVPEVVARNVFYNFIHAYVYKHMHILILIHRCGKSYVWCRWLFIENTIKYKLHYPTPQFEHPIYQQVKLLMNWWRETLIQDSNFLLRTDITMQSLTTSNMTDHNNYDFTVNWQKSNRAQDIFLVVVTEEMTALNTDFLGIMSSIRTICCCLFIVRKGRAWSAV